MRVVIGLGLIILSAVLTVAIAIYFFRDFNSFDEGEGKWVTKKNHN